LDSIAKLKRKIKFAKELKEDTTLKIKIKIKKNYKLNILIKRWNWKQLNIYIKNKKKIKKKTIIEYEK